MDKPIVFNFHGYPWLIHRLAYNRTNHNNLHVRGYIERGNINTPMELAIENEIDRFTLAIDVIDRVPTPAKHRRPRQREISQHADRLRDDMRTDIGIDKPEIVEWRWPLLTMAELLGERNEDSFPWGYR